MSFENDHLRQIKSQVKSQLYKGLNPINVSKQDAQLLGIIANYLDKLNLTATLNTLQSECNYIPSNDDLVNIYDYYKTSDTLNYDLNHLQNHYANLLRDIENKHSIDLAKQEEQYKQLYYQLQQDYDSYKRLIQHKLENINKSPSHFVLESIQRDLMELKSAVLDLQVKKDPYLYELEGIKQLLKNDVRPFPKQPAAFTHEHESVYQYKQQLDQMSLRNKELQRELADLRYLNANTPNAKESRANSIKSDLSQNELKLLRKRSPEKNNNTGYDLSPAELKLLSKESNEVEIERDGVGSDLSNSELRLLRQSKTDKPEKYEKSPNKNEKNVSFSTNDQQMDELDKMDKNGKHVVIAAVDEQIDDLKTDLDPPMEDLKVIDLPVQDDVNLYSFRWFLARKQKIYHGNPINKNTIYFYKEFT
eukprot:NODE_75_length_23955_cov_0.435069.p4 type:complete len:419 gc:universal NODE_75_length_23955_cov_0.435069:8336-9592(+)